MDHFVLWEIQYVSSWLFLVCMFLWSVKKKSVHPQAEIASPSVQELKSINMESERVLSVLVIQVMILFNIPRIPHNYIGLVAHLFLYQGHYQIASTMGIELYYFDYFFGFAV